MNMTLHPLDLRPDEIVWLNTNAGRCSGCGHRDVFHYRAMRTEELYCSVNECECEDGCIPPVLTPEQTIERDQRQRAAMQFLFPPMVGPRFIAAVIPVTAEILADVYRPADSEGGETD